MENITGIRGMSRPPACAAAALSSAPAVAHLARHGARDWSLARKCSCSRRSLLCRIHASYSPERNLIVGKIAGVLSSMFFLLFRPISRALHQRPLGTGEEPTRKHAVTMVCMMLRAA